MIMYSSPSSLISLPEYLPNRMRSPTATSSGTSLPSSRRLRSEEHTSELQSPDHLVCRLLLEKKKKRIHNDTKSNTKLMPINTCATMNTRSLLQATVHLFDTVRLPLNTHFTSLAAYSCRDRNI